MYLLLTCVKYEILFNPLMEFFEVDSIIREDLCDLSSKEKVND